VNNERLHSLDAVRAFALLLGVVIHTSLSFLPGEAWPILDHSRSMTLAVVFFSSHLFRMVLFFTVAGFFAHLLLEKRGMGGFWANRLKRIGIPLVGGWILIFPLVVVAIIFGYLRSHPGVPSAPPTPAQPVGYFPFAHFWFLYYLLLFYAAASVIRGVAGLLRLAGPAMWLADRITAFIVKSGVLVLALGLPAAWALYQQAAWFPWLGIPTPDMSVIPQTPALAAFGTAFAVGWLLHRQQGLLASIQKLGIVYLAGAVALTTVCLLRGGTSPLAGLPKLEFALAYTAAAWLWSFGIIGIAVGYLHRESPVRRYLADASYWIYLTHLPLVLALQGVVAPLGWPWFVKFPLIVTATLAVLLLSYHYLVRPTRLGVLLNGRRYPRRMPAGDPVAAVPSLP
jgi:peptidoglycan/LPS O-acetylase OafA/YrhL